MVYFITDDHGHTKIGCTDQSIEKRVKELQTGNPYTLRVERLIQLKFKSSIWISSHSVEQRLHLYFDDCRIRGEWFRTEGLQEFYKLSNDEISELISELLQENVVCNIQSWIEIKDNYMAKIDKLEKENAKMKAELKTKRQKDKEQKAEIKRLRNFIDSHYGNVVKFERG